jgi:hypothetical protein
MREGFWRRNSFFGAVQVGSEDVRLMGAEETRSFDKEGRVFKLWTHCHSSALDCNGSVFNNS